MSTWAITQVLQTSPVTMLLQHFMDVKGQNPLAEQKAGQMQLQFLSQNLLSRM